MKIIHDAIWPNLKMFRNTKYKEKGKYESFQAIIYHYKLFESKMINSI